ncbi:MAG: peptide-methionine (S)-S-oxide reductase MsrA [Alphaproteobacteria bacterium]|nr:peptide-methionine (S)-S-oxide reductase MsrA [Alphaproteobacteria bacterium]
MSKIFVGLNVLLAVVLAFLFVPSIVNVSSSGAAAVADPKGSQVVIFAGGCFWCVEADFDKVPGVLSTTSGYIGGRVANPTYSQVSSGSTGHTEAVRIVYDPTKVTFERLLFIFWRTIDPVTKDAQFCDYGTQYRTGIFATGDAQLQAALASRAALDKSGRLKRPIVTEILPAGPFYPAEDYHQDYYKKEPLRYNLYRFNCGRDARLDALWGAEAGGGTR